MKLAIWFDIDCPNCFLAIKQFYRLYHYMGYRLEEDEITFCPIRLNPTLKTNTEKTYLEAFRSHSYLKRRKQEKAIKNFIILGQDEGINFNFEKLFPLNTTKALQLIHYTQKYEKDKLEAVILKLFENYFLHFKNLDDDAFLIKFAQKLKLNTDKVKEMYKQGTFIQTLENDAKRANRLGVASVPLFIFNEDRALLGYYGDEKVKEMIVDAHLASKL